MATVHRHSFTRLSKEQNDNQYSLNVVFIHGLRGHPRRTWETTASASNGASDTTKKPKGWKLFKRRTSKSPATDIERAQSPSVSSSSSSSPTIFWPEEFLAVDVPRAQIWTYGYNADVIGGVFQANNKNSISQHGQDLSVRLEREIGNSNPIAFVVHSLGGVILKDALRRSEIIREQTKLIIFLGTPHRGSAYAGWGQIASNLARLALQDSNKKILETLEVNNEVLDNIHEEFKSIAFKGAIKIHSFQEGRGIAGMKGLDEKVVEDFSSKLDLPRALETVESIDANHMQMVRYNSKDDQGYRAILGILNGFIRQGLESQHILPAQVVNVPDVASSNALFTVPFSRDDYFIGREDIIAEIREHRATSQTHTRIALVGLGGVGKSQIAIEYAYQTQKAEPQTLVFWIHASNSIRFQQGYRDIAEKAPLPGREDPKADILQLVHAWLSGSRVGRWLMILDNVDDDDVFFANDDVTASSTPTIEATDHKRPLESCLPQTPNGTILITSRNKAAAINLVGGNRSIVHVEPMDEEDALALLQTRVPFSESDQEDAKALIYALECIPLAIAHAAAYIKTRAPAMNISAYLKLFREGEANQVQLLSKKEWKDIRRDHIIRHAVIATWQISFKHIQKTAPSAADLLALISMFDKQEVPKWLLQGNTSQLDFDDALAPLIGFSLIRIGREEQALEMHRLVQLSMRTWLEAEKELSKWVKKSIGALTEAFPSGDYKTWGVCKILLPHAAEIMSHRTEDEEDIINQSNSAFKAGWYLYLRGEYKVAQDFFQVSLDAREKLFGPKHPVVLNSLRNLGLVLERQGEYAEAEAMHRRAIEGYEKVLGIEHPHTLTSTRHLGSVLERQGKYEEAEAMHRRALGGREKVLGIDHPDTLNSANNLGLVLERQGKYEAAEAMHWRALGGYEKVLGVDHPDTLNSANNLGSVLQGQGKYEEAEAIHRRALGRYEKVLGVDHPDTLNSANTLGSVLERQGKYEAAEALHRRALRGYEKVLGIEHPDTLTSADNLGSVLERQGKFEEAEAMHRRALGGYEKVLGIEHPDTLNSADNLGSVLQRQGKYEEAGAMHRRALGGYEKVLGIEHPDTLTSANNLGSVLERQGKYEEAEAMHRRALEGREKVLGVDHPETLISVHWLAYFFHRQQQYPAAIELYQRAYNGYVKCLGPQHPSTVGCFSHYQSAIKHMEV